MFSRFKELLDTPLDSLLPLGLDALNFESTTESEAVTVATIIPDSSESSSVPVQSTLGPPVNSQRNPTGAFSLLLDLSAQEQIFEDRETLAAATAEDLQLKLESTASLKLQLENSERENMEKEKQKHGNLKILTKHWSVKLS